MTINLDQTYIDPNLKQDGQKVFEPLLDNLQCNILKSHGREWAFHIFLKFTGDPQAVRAWIRNFSKQYVTSTSTQLQQSREFKKRQQLALENKRRELRLKRLQEDLNLLEQQNLEDGAVVREAALGTLALMAGSDEAEVLRRRARLEKELAKLEDVAATEEELSELEDELIGAFFLSAEGYKYLGFDTRDFSDEGKTFQKGMKNQDNSLLDGILDMSNKDPKPQTWEEPYRETIHAMLLLARDWQGGKALSATLRDDIIPSLAGIADPVAIEEGHVLRNNQAQARGKDESAAEGEGEGSRKGQPIEHFGYVDGRSQPLFLKSDIDKEEGGMDRWDPTAPLSLVLVPDPYGQGEDSYGSYFVFRKLEQDVIAFNERISTLAANLNVHPEVAGALAVGRFKDGTPITLQRMPGLRDPNNFEYESIDREGNRCPAHAHIRKVNPRGTTPLTQRQDEREHRIARRGIPYGAPEDVGIKPVGLLFMCYQSDINKQFEFLQRTWADNPNFPDFAKPLIAAGTGDDPIIGQDTDANAGQKWPTEWGRPNEVSFNFGGYVTLRGGEYFFAPSISFLLNM